MNFASNQKKLYLNSELIKPQAEKLIKNMAIDLELTAKEHRNSNLIIHYTHTEQLFTELAIRQK